MMTLSELLADLREVPQECNVSLSGLALDSRLVSEGDLFLAYMGTATDGKLFINDAISRGAAAILYEAEKNEPLAFRVITHNNKIIPLLALENLPFHAGTLAAKFFQQPSHGIRIIGITGTNGKTSCSQYVAEVLQMMGKSCGVIGTLGCGVFGQLRETHLTTLDPISLQKTLAQFKQAGVSNVTMEVSSHSLVQGRVRGVEFDTAVFTNLTQDHLDYHGDMASYANAKRKLFEQFNIRQAVINADDNFGRELLNTLPKAIQLFAYSVSENTVSSVPGAAMVAANHVRLEPHGITAHVSTPWGDGVLQSHLLGRFNVSNLLAVIATLGIMGISLPKILDCVSKLRGVPGRMEVFGGGNKPLVVVDYAHTPDALEQVLGALREHCQGQLWCVFGCGGNRDRGKRPLMGKVVEQWADRIVVTDDNPREENPQAIVSDILSGMSKEAPLVVEHDRRRAISHAMDCAQPGDVVLVAGKGHETYQQIGQEKYAFSDALEVKMRLAD